MCSSVKINQMGIDSFNRVMVFIDGSNFYKGLSLVAGTGYRLDFGKFINYLIGDRHLVRSYYYNVVLPEGESSAKVHQGFINYIKSVPRVTVKLGKLEKRGSDFAEKGVDIQIAVDMVKLGIKRAYDTAILVSGDSDFTDVIKAVQDEGIIVENASFEPISSYRLAQQSDCYISLDHLDWDKFRAPTMKEEFTNQDG